MAEERNKEITTIKISKKTKERLERLRIYRRESYEEIMERLLDLLNLCRIEPEKAKARLISFEKQRKKEHNQIAKKVYLIKQNNR